MAQTRFTFSPLMDLNYYKQHLGEVRGTSRTESVGQAYGSFLGAYLTHHLMSPPTGMNAEALLMRDKATIQALLQDGCVITYNASEQLLHFFNFLAKNIPLYYQLIELGFLSKDAICEEGTTFLNAYFSGVLMESLDDIDEAIQLIQFLKASLAIANKKGVFPLSAFFNLICKNDNYFSEEKDDVFIEKLSRLVDSFSLERAHPLNVDEFTKQCVEFFKDYRSDDEVRWFFYRILMRAVDYGMDLYQPIEELSNNSFSTFMIVYAVDRRLPMETVRAYYLAFSEGLQLVRLPTWERVDIKAVPVVVDAKTKQLSGVLRLETDIFDGLAGYDFFGADESDKNEDIFDIFTMAKFFPLSVLGSLYFNEHIKYSYRLLVWKGEEAVIPRFLQGMPNEIKLRNIPEAMRPGVPVNTADGGFVYVRFVEKDNRIFVELIDITFEDYGDSPKKIHVLDEEDFDQKYREAVRLFKEKYSIVLSEALMNRGNYFPIKQYFAMQEYYSENRVKMDILESYFRMTGKNKGNDPRVSYQFRRRFERKHFLNPLLVGEKKCNSVYLSEDGYTWKHCKGKNEAVLTRVFYYDLIVLRHLKKIGFAFNTSFIEGFIVNLLLRGNYADPAFYNLLRCLFECGAKFPETVEGQPMAGYIQARVVALKPEDKVAACRDHFEKVLELFDAEQGDVVGNLRAYLTSFGFDLPDACVTKKSAFSYMQSQAGLVAFSVALDTRLPNVNTFLFDTKKHLLAFAESVNGERGDVKCLLVALDHYLRSGDYAFCLKMEDSYYQLFRSVILAMCEVLYARLEKEMKVDVLDAFKEKFDSAKRRIRSDHLKLVRGLQEALRGILNESPYDTVGRQRHLAQYFDFFQQVESLFVGKEKEIEERVTSNTLREVLRAFLYGVLLEGQISMDVEMQHALGVLTGRNYGDVQMLMLATAPESAPPMDDEVDEYVPPDVPEAPEVKTPRLELIPSVGKRMTMFGAKEYPSAAFLSAIKVYQAMIDKLFYADASRDTLVAVINRINVQLDDSVVSDPILRPLICPFTNKVPFYPCGSQGRMIYLDSTVLTQYYKQTIKHEGVIVDEDSIKWLEEREIMLFFTHLQAVDEVLKMRSDYRSALTFS